MIVDMRLGNTPLWYLNHRKDASLRVTDEVRKCVVFIGLPLVSSDGQQVIKYKGTAFFVAVPTSVVVPTSIKGETHSYLVTAKHVAMKLQDKQFFVRINSKDGSSKLLQGEGTKWWTHPTDNSVDVAIIPSSPTVEEFDYVGIPISMFLSDDIIKTKGIGTGDEVFITGLFAHLAGSSKNLPIVRMGNIAMMPDEPVPTRNLGDIDAYLIEARSIGGLSGSPAFVRQTVQLGIGESYLLGLVHGHWDIPSSERDDEVLMDADLVGKVNMGIAIVVPAKKILEVINHPELVEMRRVEEEEKIRRQNPPTADKKIT